VPGGDAIGGADDNGSISADEAAGLLIATALVLILVRFRVLTVAAALIEASLRSLAMLWTFHWSIQNASPTGGLLISIADVILLHMLRRAFRQQPGGADESAP